MEEELREKAYRFVIYFSIGIGFLTVLSITVTLPMAYNYVSHIDAQMANDLSYCRVTMDIPFTSH